MIRTRFQSDTPFFPNMLNNGKVEVSLKEDVDKVIADKDFLIRMMRRRIYQLKLADAIEKKKFWVNQKIWWESLKDKVETQPLYDYSAKVKTWTRRVDKYKAKLNELKELK